MIKFPAYFSGFSSKADGSASLRFATQELQPADFAELQAVHNLFGTLVFRENELQDEEIPKEDAEENKTPSKRQRAVLYRLWEQDGKRGEFNSFYREKMEKIIDRLKARLDNV